MIKEGRSKILYFGKNEGISVAENRYKGYEKALEEHGILLDEKLVVHTKRTFDDAHSKMKLVIEKDLEFDAIVCIGGLVAYGAGSAIVDAKLKVPEDVILGEFGDNEILSRLGIPFYTVCQNPYEIGKTAVNQLIRELEDKENSKTENIIIESKVIYRNFTGN
jgi:DNA-binding LacI/PurR family transcriptional regulator